VDQHVVVANAAGYFGPVSYFVGIAASLAGDFPSAERNLLHAASEATRIGAPVAAMRTDLAVAELYASMDAPDGRVHEHATQAANVARELALRPSIARAEALLSSFENVGAAPDTAVAVATQVPALQAKAAYRDRVRELSAELDDAEQSNDLGRVAKARAEMEALTNELTRAVGLGGRDRKAGSQTERARLNITRSVRAVLKRLQSEHPALGDHLDAAIKTGQFCSYSPDPELRLEWDIMRSGD
jgi:hypothetical protein